MSAGLIGGNVKCMGVLSITVDLDSVNTNTSGETTVTVPGLQVGDFVAVNKPSLEAGIVVGTCRVSAANTLAIQVINTTGGSVNEASETFIVFWARPEGVVSAANE